jgi:hypothetical protein
MCSERDSVVLGMQKYNGFMPWGSHHQFCIALAAGTCQPQQLSTLKEQCSMHSCCELCGDAPALGCCLQQLLFNSLPPDSCLHGAIPSFADFLTCMEQCGRGTLTALSMPQDSLGCTPMHCNIRSGRFSLPSGTLCHTVYSSATSTRELPKSMTIQIVPSTPCHCHCHSVVILPQGICCTLEQGQGCAGRKRHLSSPSAHCFPSSQLPV